MASGYPRNPSHFNGSVAGNIFPGPKRARWIKAQVGHWPGLDLQCVVAPCMIIYMEVQEDGIESMDGLLIDGWRIDGEILQTGYIDKIEVIE